MKSVIIFVTVAICAINARNVKVVGGVDAIGRNQFPHQISLNFNIGGGQFVHICGGSILTPTWVVSAGHCFSTTDPKAFLVFAGVLKLSGRGTDPEVQISPVKEILVHEDFTQNPSIVFDIALLSLHIPLVYNDYVNFIRLPTTNVLPGQYVTLSGWGSMSNTTVPSMPDHLQFAELPIVGLQECKQRMLPLIVDDMNICTGPLDGSKSGCSGDSGGPLINGNELCGIVSWGTIPCAIPGKPAMYTDVMQFLDWILARVDNLPYDI